jgi:DNA-directed RNA polymerase subunit RPC12/RpoP
MGKCDICGKNGENLSLIGANHKKLGYIKICADCWEKLYGENEFVGGTTSGGAGVSCPTCG